MNAPPPPPAVIFPHRHLLGIEGLGAAEITALLDLAEDEVAVSRQVEKKKSVLRGRTQIASTQSNSERAARRSKRMRVRRFNA